MFVLVNLVEAIIYVFDTVLSVYSFAVIGFCLISWVNPDPYNPIVRFLRGITEPALWRIRKYLPFTFMGGLDLSPIILLLGIQLFKIIVIKSLYQALAMLLS